jgi:hypothetical protein
MKYILYLFLIIITTSCATTATFEIDEPTPKLVVNAILTADSIWNIQVSQSKFILDTIRFESIENATVEVYHQGQFLMNLTDFVPSGFANGIGYYTNLNTTIRPIAGESYTIKVAAPNFGNTIANDVIPIGSAVSNINYNLEIGEKRNFDYPIEGQISFTINDAVSTNDFYVVRLFYESDYIQTNRVIGTVIQLLDSISTKKLNYNIDFPTATRSIIFDRNSVFSDEFFNGTARIFNLQINDDLELKSHEPDILYLQIINLSKIYYDYALDFNEQLRASQDPFAEPFPVFSNVENGFGIVVGQVVQTFVIEL